MDKCGKCDKSVQDIDINSLSDINDIVINNELTKEERIKDYLIQIKNPYCFRCGDMIIEVSYGNSGITIEDCLKDYIKNLI